MNARQLKFHCIQLMTLATLKNDERIERIQDPNILALAIALGEAQDLLRLSRCPAKNDVDMIELWLNILSRLLENRLLSVRERISRYLWLKNMFKFACRIHLNYLR